MNCDRSHFSRGLSYHLISGTDSTSGKPRDGKKALKDQIALRVKARKNGMTKKELHRWFRATDSAFIDAALFYMVCFEKPPRIANRQQSPRHRRRNQAYTYESVEEK
jgi:hypothetical protein